MEDHSANGGRAQEAMRMAKEIMDQEWITAGKTREELDREEQIDCLFDALVGAGYSEEKLIADWQTKTAEQILREYALPGDNVASVLLPS